MSSKEKARISPAAPIDSLGVVGKSWYKRGLRYWFIRTMTVIFLFLMTLMIIAMAIGITIGILQAGAPAWVVIPIMVILSVGSSIKNAQSIVRKRREQDAVQDSQLYVENARSSVERSRMRGAGGGAAALGSVVGALGGLGAFLLAICLPIAVGVVPVALWYWLQPLVPGELRARRKVAHWLTAVGRQADIPAGWGLS